MFTGLIQKTALIEVIESNSNGLRLALDTGYTDLALGESIAINGVCLTVAEKSATTGRAWFYLSPETLARTTFSQASHGRRANIERAMQVGDRLGGHIVQGHVDGVAKLSSVQTAGDAFLLEVSLPINLAPYLVEKGSITLDGISLTINQVSAPRSPETWVRLMIIPHTWKETHLKDLKVDDLMHVEVDVLAKFTERMLACRTP